MKNIEDLFKRCGSAAHLAVAVERHQFTVERWGLTGVPEKHWKAITEKFPVNVAELSKLNEVIRAANVA
jgi:hypothetical protein